MLAELDVVLQSGDVLKVDIGVHVKGRILDSAFTLTFDPAYEQLIEAVKAATDTGVRVSKFNMLEESSDVKAILRKQALMSDWENWRVIYRRRWSRMRLKSEARSIPVRDFRFLLNVATQFFAVKPIENLSGHSINPYRIHGGKSVLLVKNEDQTKMEEGEYFAIETFGSTGRGRIIESVRCCRVELIGWC